MVKDLAAGLGELETNLHSQQAWIGQQNSSRRQRSKQSSQWHRQRALANGIRFHNEIIEYDLFGLHFQLLRAFFIFVVLFSMSISRVIILV